MGFLEIECNEKALVIVVLDDIRHYVFHLQKNMQHLKCKPYNL